MTERIHLLVVNAEKDGQPLELDALNGRTFQLHHFGPGWLRLYPVEINDPAYDRCPVIIGGERCGERWGHTGQHCWGGGD